jgi:hypothetical protein
MAPNIIISHKISALRVSVGRSFYGAQPITGGAEAW